MSEGVGEAIILASSKSKNTKSSSLASAFSNVLGLDLETANSHR
tara:strand:+ start:2347 stop:2478 length:132 start_codon:yes stop_codon:yes gene_type:complete